MEVHQAACDLMFVSNLFSVSGMTELCFGDNYLDLTEKKRKETQYNCIARPLDDLLDECSGGNHR